MIGSVGLNQHIIHVSPKIFELAKSSLVRAIGETGLDFNTNFSSKKNQIKSFIDHIRIANKVNLPLFLHQRDAHKDFINCVSAEEILTKGVVHCFTGSVSELYDYLDHDLYIGITGWLCDPKRGKDLEQVIPKIPLEKLMIETDCPYLIPKNIANKPKNNRNEPQFLPHIANEVATLMNINLEEFNKQVLNNSKSFFGVNFQV